MQKSALLNPFNVYSCHKPFFFFWVKCKIHSTKNNIYNVLRAYPERYKNPTLKIIQANHVGKESKGPYTM